MRVPNPASLFYFSMTAFRQLFIFLLVFLNNGYHKSNVHSLYVGYLLNPFNKKMGIIDSHRFDRRIDSVLDAFNSPRQSELLDTK